MKSSIYTVIAPAVMLLALVSGCDAVKDDIVAYSKSAVPVVNSFGAGFRAKMEDVSKGDDKATYVARTRAELIPMLQGFKAKLVAIKPESKELQAIHTTYIAGVTSLEEGIKALADSIDKEDTALAETAKKKIEAGEAAEAAFKKGLDALAKEHGVKFE